ncbi:sigma-54-dependent Fis family transcriptional regulator [Ginsengibacter hankyongi]|uniref:Sigma-54-dependent Fis family transcriptional regulator n=1 Tax=Ginsengibacter hankyongi TaxID=2607284 RepID=A0A5J5IJ64_9BACT|nr:sigma-54 dependent transcriptional regulator [Ginsengibacter hankyongi]KAA9038757.1 sigma-54-dependent Fis family transcriptional regulator [Ginsengibacter hankyongi]
MMNKVLIIDDEEKLRNLLGRLIKLEGFAVTESGNLKQAYRAIEKEEPDVILCDVKLPDGNGIDFIKEIKARYFVVEVILLTAYGNIPDGIQAMKNGAFDYLVKGNDNDKVIPLLNKAIEKVELKKKIASLEKQVGKKYTFESIIGTSSLIIDAVNLAKKVAPTDATVLLLGETGTGKEVFAQAIHNASSRVDKPFMALNCSSFTKELLESEIFGHKAGAFTGAIKDKKGLIEEADSGTLFLDEIGEMPLELQSKLLRVLETGEFIKVGDTHTTKVDVRVIAATNRNLQEDVENLKFREDLFYRLNVFTIVLPPLRERRKDIPALSQFFLKIFSAKTNNVASGMSKEFVEHLQQHDWKGNIRELKNIIERAVILTGSPELTLENLPLDLQVSSSKTASSFDLATVEKSHIQKVLLYTKGNKTEAAKLLNIGLTTLYRKIEEYGLS